MAVDAFFFHRTGRTGLTGHVGLIGLRFRYSRGVMREVGCCTASLTIIMESVELKNEEIVFFERRRDEYRRSENSQDDETDWDVQDHEDENEEYEEEEWELDGRNMWNGMALAVSIIAQLCIQCFTFGQLAALRLISCERLGMQRLGSWPWRLRASLYIAKYGAMLPAQNMFLTSLGQFYFASGRTATLPIESRSMTGPRELFVLETDPKLLGKQSTLMNTTEWKVHQPPSQSRGCVGLWIQMKTTPRTADWVHSLGPVFQCDE